MKEIKLTNGDTALVDDYDYDYLQRIKWCYVQMKNTKYVVRWFSRINGKQPPNKYLHHEVLGNPPSGLEIDHKDGNGLNCQRHNMRFVTVRQNQQNQINRKKSSKLVGASWHKRVKKWQAQINIDGKNVYLGYFNTDKDAHLAYCNKIKELGQVILGSLDAGCQS